MSRAAPRATKRGAPESLAPPDDKRTHREPSNALEEDQDDFAQYGRDVKQKAATWVSLCPVVTNDVLQQAVPSAPTQFDDTYTREDEIQVQKTWQEDPLRQHFLNHSKNNIMLRLWKMTQRLWPGIYPEVLISEVNMLEYEHVRVRAKVKDANGQDVPSPYWSKDFCAALETLMVHPFWNFDLPEMIVYIQYAVMCRTNDQRTQTWPQEGPTDSMLWSAFQEVTSTRQEQTIVKVHREALDKVKSKTAQQVSSLASRLLRKIEDQAFEKKTKPFKPAPGAPFKVRSTDLETVIKALNALDGSGVPLFAPAVGYRKALSKAMSHQEAAPSAANLEGFREKVLIDLRRAKFKAEKLGTPMATVMTMPPMPKPPMMESLGESNQTISNSVNSATNAMSGPAVNSDAEPCPAPRRRPKTRVLSYLPPFTVEDEATIQDKMTAFSPKVPDLLMPITPKSNVTLVPGKEPFNLFKQHTINRHNLE